MTQVELTYRQIVEIQNVMQAISTMPTVGDVGLDLQLEEWIVEVDKKIGIVQQRATKYARGLIAIADDTEKKARRRRRKDDSDSDDQPDMLRRDLTPDEEEMVREFQETEIFPNTCTISLPKIDGFALRECGTIPLGQMAYLRPILSYDQSNKSNDTKASKSKGE